MNGMAGPRPILGLALLGSLALFPASGLGESAEEVPLGARAIGMGSAFSSIADDATAPFWNPAGLPWVGHQEITGTHANLYDSGIRESYAAFLLPLAAHHAVALGWYHSGFLDSELEFGENRIDFAYGRRLASFVTAGVTVKYMGRNTALDGVSVRRGNGFGADFGVLATPLNRLRLALTLQDAFDTKVSYTEGNATVLAYPRTLRVGASYPVLRNVLLALDLDGRYHLGGEYQVMPELALRAGLEKDPSSDEDALSPSFGAGLKLGLLRFDYALVDRPVLGSTNHFALSMAFNFNPAQIRIEKVEARDLYGSLYKTYAREPFGSMTVRNLDEKPVEATVRVFMPELMEAPSTQNVVLRPKAVQQIPLTAVLSERVMERKDDRPVQVEVTATYQSRRLPRTEKASARCVAYGPGAIDWDAGVAQAAAFVTTKDPMVDAVAREAVRSLPASGDIPAGHRNLANTAAIFDALGTLGITYVPDPNNPYSSIAETPRAVDAVSYPRETLVRRTGDCDDTTVLLAALLGNVGIATQIVDVPGHLFLLVDAGVHERNRLSLAVDESRYVVSEDQVWIPVETTALKDGFVQAWSAGADAYRSWSARGKLALASVPEAQFRYEPAETPGASPAPPAIDAARLKTQLDADLQTLRQWSADFLAQLHSSTPQGVQASPEALNEIAHVHFLAGKLDQARAQLEQALPLETNAARTHNNLGNVLVAQGDVTGALEHYQAAVKAEEGAGGLWLNLGLVRYASGDTVGAEEPLAKGLEASGGYAEACRLLGLDPGIAGDREGGQKMSEEEARLLLKSALRKVPAPGSKAPAPPAVAAPAPTPPAKWTSRVAGGRAGEPMLTEILYWMP